MYATFVKAGNVQFYWGTVSMAVGIIGLNSGEAPFKSILIRGVYPLKSVENVGWTGFHPGAVFPDS